MPEAELTKTSREREDRDDHRELSYLPRPLAVSPQFDSLLLFGAWVAERREKKLGLTPSKFAKEADVSERWLAEVERGRLYPSSKGFALLDDALDPDLEGTTAIEMLMHFSGNPWEEQALELRRQRDIEPIRPSEVRSAAQTSTSPFLFIQRLDHRDRLLTIGPVIAVTGILATFIANRPWVYEGAHFAKVDTGSLLLLGTGIVAVFSVAVPQLSGAIERLVTLRRRAPSYVRAKLRRRKRSVVSGQVEKKRSALECHQELMEIRELEHFSELDFPFDIYNRSRNWSPSKSWYDENDVPHLIPAIAADYKATSTELEVTERLNLIAGLGTLVAVVAIALSINGSDSGDSWRWLKQTIGWSIAAIAFAWVTWVSSRQLDGLARATVVKLARAYGLRN